VHLSTWENVTLLWYLLSLHDRILHQQHVVATVVRMNRDFEISTLHTSCQSKCRRRILQLEEFSRLGLVVKVNRSVNQHSAHEPAHLFHVDQLCPFVRLRVIALDRAENCLVLAKAAAHIYSTLVSNDGTTEPGLMHRSHCLPLIGPRTVTLDSVEGSPPEASSWRVHPTNRVQEPSKLDKSTLPTLGREVGNGCPSAQHRQHPSP